jgi:hypothetical protein
MGFRRGDPGARIRLDVLRLVTAVVAALLAGMLSAASAGAHMTWDQAAADGDFPVYQPTQTLGLKLSRLAIVACHVPATVGTPLVAESGKRHSRRGWFSVTESLPACRTSRAQRVVRRITINGVTVKVAVNCPPTSCHVTAEDGVRLGYRLLWRNGVTRRTFIDLRTRRLSLTRIVRVARSLTRVRLNRRTLQLLSFRSPDHQIWCVMVQYPARDSAFCGSRSGSLFAEVVRDGTVTICNHPNPSPDDVCLQDFDSRAPVLGSGHASEVNGFRCISATQMITCTVIGGGPGTGKGFEMSAGAVTRVGP